MENIKFFLKKNLNMKVIQTDHLDQEIKLRMHVKKNLPVQWLKQYNILSSIFKPLLILLLPFSPKEYVICIIYLYIKSLVATK